MTKSAFAEFIKNRIVILDGAMGSNLQKAGMPTGVSPEKWILENEDVVINLQRSYVNSGSDILYAPTFTANRIKLQEYGLADDILEINKRLVQISKKAANGKALVAGDLSMTGVSLAPIGNFEFEDLINIYKEQIKCLVEGGVDLLVIETMLSLQETRACIIAAKEVSDLPIMASLTFEPDGRTLYGTDAATAAIVLESLGASCIGANCSCGPDKLVPVIQKMRQVASTPILAKPNAGLPYCDEHGDTHYDMDAKTFSDEMSKLIDAGASIIGGCCGTTPKYIESIKKYKDKEVVSYHDINARYVCSERKTFSFEVKNNPFFVVGERINPTGKKKLQEALRNNEFELVQQYAEDQEAAGAQLLDVNMGMGGIDEKECMLEAIERISEVSNLPLSLDSSYITVLEAALRKYPGRALVNSVSAEKEKLEKLLPIIKKYGAMFILLPLSEEGLPKSKEEKENLISLIYQKALSVGLTKKDIVVDGLVTTVGANSKAALETLETIHKCYEDDFATICGLSNISFGLPDRIGVNSVFLSMAIKDGLTMAIANPMQMQLMESAFATDMLLDKPDSAIRFIEFSEKLQEYKDNQTQKPNVITRQPSEIKNFVVNQDNLKNEQLRPVYQDVLKGNKRSIIKTIQQILESNKDITPKNILDDALLPGINIVGDYFDKGKYFLPQLIAGAEAMKTAIEYLEPLLMKNQESSDKDTIIIATVEGDIHDIGKNLVALMLKNYGFEVIDLGKDVPAEIIVEEAINKKAKIVALSALMTTTMKQMEKVISLAKEKQLNAKIMVGGAVITEEYAKQIGADGYSKDAADAVKLAGKLLNLPF